jgi:tetratricopeptide (TPR) repeat protein
MFKTRNILLAVLIATLPKLSVAETIQKKDISTQKSGSQKLADETSMRAWEALRAGRLEDARYQFNQAFLFDNSNALALWGMAVIHANKGAYAESLTNFEKAEPLLADDLNFSVDYARTLGHAGVAAKSEIMVANAFDRFNRIFEKSPHHMMNLQNWAVILFFVGEYATAWEKITLAEATPEGGLVDQKFISALQSKMPRPSKLTPAKTN